MSSRDLYARAFACEASDAQRVAECLRDSPFVDPDSVQHVPESHRVLYELDESRVPSVDLACADRAVRAVLERVVSSHEYRP